MFWILFCGIVLLHQYTMFLTQNIKRSPKPILHNIFFLSSSCLIHTQFKSYLSNGHKNS